MFEMTPTPSFDVGRGCLRVPPGKKKKRKKKNHVNMWLLVHFRCTV
jgi:hypothetical protein